MKKVVFITMLACTFSLALLEAKTYATVNGNPITEKDLEPLKQANPSLDFDKLPEIEREMILNELITQKLILDAAKAEKLDSTKEYTSTLEAFKKDLLLRAWQQKQMQSVQMPNINEEQIQQIYQQNKDNFIDQEGKARHILVSTEDEAKAIISELNKVKGRVEPKFIDLANQKTIDPASKQQQNGGDLGTFHRFAMMPEFSKAAFDLKPGTYTKTPVKTQFGYHVIYLESKTEPKAISYDQAKQMIAQNMQMEAVRQAIGSKVQELRQKANIQINK